MKKPIDKPKEIRILLNRVSSLLSLKRISTLGDMLDILGETWDARLYPPRETPLTFDLFRKLKAEIEARLVSGAQQVKVSEEDNLTLDTLYLTNNFLIDAEEYIGQLSAKERRQSKKPWMNWELWDSIATPEQTCIPKYFQEEAAREVLYNMVMFNNRAHLLRGKVGEGKTIAYGSILRKLVNLKWLEGKTMSPYPIVILTKGSVVEQTKQELKEHFGLDLQNGGVLVTNYDSLRATFGKEFLDKITKVQDGVPYTVWKWKPFMHPCILVLDECQELKNDGSEKSQIIDAFNEIDYKHYGETYQIYSSASPFAKVASAKRFCVATRIPFKHGLGETPLNNKTWPMFTQLFTDDPHDYDPTSLKKLCRTMNEYIVPFRNVRSRFHAINGVKKIDFDTPQDRKTYDESWEKFEEKKLKLEGQPNAGLQILVALLVHRMSASILKANRIAKELYAARQRGKAPAFACPFRPSIAKVVKTLYMDYGIPRDKIALIWGGNNAYQEDVALTVDEIRNILKKVIQGENVSTKLIKQATEQLAAEENGLVNLPSELRLGMQSRKERWSEIQRYMNGEAEYCLFTFGCGGAGLNLHHKYEHTLPRELLAEATWNEMEMYQAFGRCARLTSLSDTIQNVYVYKDTVEERVLGRVSQKNRSLNVIVEHGSYSENSLRDTEALLKLAGSKTAITDDDEDAIGEEIFDEVEKESNET